MWPPFGSPSTDHPVWIPQTSGTVTLWRTTLSRKYLRQVSFGDWRAYHHHVSITFSCYHPTTTTTKRGTTISAKPRGIQVPWIGFDSRISLVVTKISSGTGPKSVVILKFNDSMQSVFSRRITTRWGAWDEFKHVDLATPSYLHPADGVKG